MYPGYPFESELLKVILARIEPFYYESANICPRSIQ